MLCIHPTPSEEYRSTITYKSVYFKSGLDKLIAKIPLEGKDVKYRYVYDPKSREIRPPLPNSCLSHPLV